MDGEGMVVCLQTRKEEFLLTDFYLYFVRLVDAETVLRNFYDRQID